VAAVALEQLEDTIFGMLDTTVVMAMCQNITLEEKVETVLDQLLLVIHEYMLVVVAVVVTTAAIQVLY
jgi:hypothetical protein